MSSVPAESALVWRWELQRSAWALPQDAWWAVLEIPLSPPGQGRGTACRTVGYQVRFDDFMSRLSFAAEHSAVPRLREQDQRIALESLCLGLRSFTELRAAAKNGGFIRALEGRLPPHARRELEEVAPSFIRLPCGRRARVHYSKEKPPWIASRLQDFFGLRETPRVARGEVPVVLHLLAPNQRPVQTTTDLTGFWQRLYPATRRQLRRRYPKHDWPENPLISPL